MDVLKEIALNDEISRIICRPGHTYNATTRRCYPVVGEAASETKGSANDAVKAEVAMRASQGLSK